MLGLAILLSLTAVGLVLGLAFFWSNARDILVASAIAVTGVVLQDSVRHYLLTARKSVLLLSGDLFVLVFAVGGIYYLGAIGQNPPAMIVLWGTAATIVAIAVMIIDGAKPRILHAYRWLRKNWGSSSAFFMEAVMGAIVGYLVVVILAIYTSDSEVAAFRAVVSVFGITSLVINFLRTAVLRELTPKTLQFQKAIISKCLQIAALVFGTVLLTLLIVRLLPGNLGSLLLGESWELVVGLALIAAINRLVAGISIAPLIVLRVQGVSWPATKIRIGATFVALALTPFAAYIAGAAGALAADSVFYAIVTIFLLRLALKNAKKSDRNPSSSAVSYPRSNKLVE
ncbi:hypothetical protein [Arthrobacter psychrochitiniphilus]|uniref:hypothetical protein n=1 Tax=Arthrobacter psychrochitiniphilus TaxID=291045 RepID=UPI003F7BB47F